MFPAKSANPGFQGSDHSYVDVVVYPRGKDPVLLTSRPDVKWVLDGQKGQDSAPSLTFVRTTKSIGTASGTFEVIIKPSKMTEILFDKLVDNDWVDIVFYTNGKLYHVMRGLIDDIGRDRSVIGTGVTIKNFSITGRDFGKIWETTPIWFSPYANDVITQAASIKIFEGVPANFRSPGVAPFYYLREFMDQFAATGGANWLPPRAMPGIIYESFVDNVYFRSKLDAEGSSMDYQNLPARKIFNPNGMNPQGMCWELAKEYSDQAFTELFVDTIAYGDPYYPPTASGDAILPVETKMTVVLRDKPFPIQEGVSAPPEYIPLWNKLPIHTVNLQEISRDNVRKSGQDRYNSFYVTPRIIQEQVSSHATNMLAPLMDRESIRQHGILRMDVTSAVTPDALDYDPFAQHQRRMLRDWYCLNPYFLSGNFELAHGRPDIKIGNRMQIPGTAITPGEIEDPESYYIESVTNTWRPKFGTRTSVGVTRGWIGTDAEYKATMTSVAKRYFEPPLVFSEPS